MAQSPMLMHAIELFEHGIEHFLDGKPTSRKFAVLHIDHAVELFLKEKVVLLGKSIYKTDGQTLSIHETFNSLKDVEISEKPRLQEIHDLRNTIQHKGITLDEATTEFYVQLAYQFVKRFTPAELNLKFADLLPERLMRLMEGQSVFTPPSSVQQIPAIDYPVNGSLIEFVIKSYTMLEQYVRKWQETNPNLKKSLRGTIMMLANENRHDLEQVKKLCGLIMGLRSKVVHSDYVPSEEELRQYIDNINVLFAMITMKEPHN